MELRVIYDALNFYARSWTLEILVALNEQPRRFTDLQRSINLPYATTLKSALQRMADHGLVTLPSDGDGTHYELTDRGKRALPLIETFVADLQWWDR